MVAEQHDIGMPRGRSPERLVDDHRIRFAPCLYQPVDILMVMERSSHALQYTSLMSG